jgi:hypothetical protein
MRNTSHFNPTLELRPENYWHQNAARDCRQPGVLARLLAMTGVLGQPASQSTPIHTDAAVSRHEIALAPRQIWSGCFDAPVRVLCRSGQLWLTQSNDAEDYLLRAGEEFVAASHVHLVFSSLGEASEFEIKALPHRPLNES